MRRPRRPATALALLLPLVLASSAVRADSSAPPRPGPGGPKISGLPDLVIDAIDVSYGPNPPCTGPNTANLDILVTLRNAGPGTAMLPTWKNWILLWTVKGGAKQLRGQPPAQLAAGQKATLKIKLSVWAQVTPDKKKSAFTLGAQADPEKVIKEVREDNNTELRTVELLGELCPQTR